MAKKQKYRALVKLTAKDRTVIAEAGEVTDQIPAKSVGWLKEQGLIALVEDEEG